MAKIDLDGSGGQESQFGKALTGENVSGEALRAAYEAQKLRNNDKYEGVKADPGRGNIRKIVMVSCIAVGVIATSSWTIFNQIKASRDEGNKVVKPLSPVLSQRSKPSPVQNNTTRIVTPPMQSQGRRFSEESLNNQADDMDE